MPVDSCRVMFSSNWRREAWLDFARQLPRASRAARRLESRVARSWKKMRNLVSPHSIGELFWLCGGPPMRITLPSESD